MSIEFGTDGIRGHADHYPFFPDALRALGIAIGRWAAMRGHPSGKTRILIGHDTRQSCQRIIDHLAQGLHHTGALIDSTGVIPTPAVLGLMQQNGIYTAGIVISASHNPYHDNGIKLFTLPDGKLSADDEASICRLFTIATLEQETASVQPTSIHHLTNAVQQYVDQLVAHVPPSLCKNISVVLDCAHGATYQAAPQAFAKLGAQVIALNTAPNGVNINQKCGALHPEELAQAVRKHKADLGFAFDGDGDRVIAVNRHGHVRDGDDLLALLTGLPEYHTQTTLVGTVMSNKGLQDFVELHGKQLIRTKVGDKYVAQSLEQHQALLGGEASGHVILRNYLASGDGIQAALKTVEALAYTDNPDMLTFIKLPQAMVNIRVQQRRELGNAPLRDVVKNYQQRVTALAGRMVVRYSGTEPLLRIMVEAPEYQQAHSLADALARELADICSK